MIIPIVFLLACIFTILFFTGNGNILKGSGEDAILVSGIMTIVFTGMYYTYQRIVTLNRFMEWCFEGMKYLFEIVVILILATAFASIINELGITEQLAKLALYVPKSMIIIATLYISILTSYSTGSSGAAVALLVPILVPITYNINIPIEIIIGAIVSGGVFGDQNSPISDSVILTTTVTEVSIINHVKTQLPFSLVALLITTIGFLAVGLLV